MLRLTNRKEISSHIGRVGMIKRFALENEKGLVFFSSQMARNRKMACAALWQILTSNKSAAANRTGGFFTRRLPKNEEIRGIILKSSKNFELFF